MTVTHLTPPDDGPAPNPTLEAERATLGSTLLSPTALADVAELLDPHHFHHPAHETIYTTILHLATTGHPVDTLTVADHLHTTGQLTRCGGTTYLHQLVNAVITPANAAWHATIVRDAHTLRTIAGVGRELAATDTTPTTTDEALEHVDAARARLDALVTDTTTTTHAGQVEAALHSLTQPPGTPTPWADLTHTIGGWRPGELVIVGARPSIGKTAFAGGILLHAAQTEHHPCMFSLEMTTEQLHLRLLSNIGSVDGGHILRRQLNPDDWQRLNEAGGHLAQLPLTIDDRSNLSLAQIRAKVRALQRTTPNLGPVIIDYLNLVRPPHGAGDDRRVQVDLIAQGLKNLSKELHTTVIALAQINRGPEGRLDKMPQMSDLRESGGIENAADTVILLHRDLSRDGDPTTMRVAVPKNRHGAVAQLDLDFAGHYTRITDHHRTWRPAPAVPYDPSAD